ELLFNLDHLPLLAGNFCERLECVTRRDCGSSVLLNANLTPTRMKQMKIVVIGGTGLIGTKLVKNLQQQGHEVVTAAPSSGINTITGEGLSDALKGARVVVDVANAPLWEDKAVLEFFETSGRNLLAAETGGGRGPPAAPFVRGAK